MINTLILAFILLLSIKSFSQQSEAVPYAIVDVPPVFTELNKEEKVWNISGIKKAFRFLNVFFNYFKTKCFILLQK